MRFGLLASLSFATVHMTVHTCMRARRRLDVPEGLLVEVWRCRRWSFQRVNKGGDEDDEEERQQEKVVAYV